MPRTPRIVGVGLPRSGTSFLSGMVAGTRRGRHDFDLVRQGLITTAYLRGGATPAAVRNYLRWRRGAIDADADICSMHQHTIGLLCETSPEAVFVLTVRDPLEWVDAYARAMTMLFPPNDVFNDLRTARCRPDRWPLLDADAPLGSLGLFSLDAYLHWWATATASALDEIPADRLVVVPTHALPDAAPRLAAASGWPRDDFAVSAAHRNAARSWPGGGTLLDALPPGHVADALHRHLGGTDWDRLGTALAPGTRELLALS